MTENVWAFVAKQDSVAWDFFRLLLKTCLLFNIGLAYPIQLFVVTDILEEWLLAPPMHAYHAVAEEEGGKTMRGRIPMAYKQNTLRAGLVALSVGVALAVPSFGLLISLVGSLGGSVLQFVMPALCYLSLLGRTASSNLRALCLLYVTVGVVSGAAGTIQAIARLIS